jgi:hypothetical protein
MRRLVLVFAMIAVALIVAADAAATVFKGRFVCQYSDQTGVQRALLEPPVPAATVQLWVTNTVEGGPVSVSSSAFRADTIASGAAHTFTSADGDFSFAISSNKDQRGPLTSSYYNFFPRVLMDDQQGVVLSDYPSTAPAGYKLLTNLADKPVQDYHTRVLGEECAVWLSVRNAYASFVQLTGHAPPFGELRIAYGGPAAGVPWVDGETVQWPIGYGDFSPEAMTSAASEAFALALDNYAAGGEDAIRSELAGWDFRQPPGLCARTDPALAFYEGFAAFWARDYVPAPNCPGVSQSDMTVAGMVAWRLTSMEHFCATASRKQMVTALLAHGRRIHSLSDFTAALGSCQTGFLDPSKIPTQPRPPAVSVGSLVSALYARAKQARLDAAKLNKRIKPAEHAARHAKCPPFPCTSAAALATAPSALTGAAAQAKALAKAYAAEAALFKGPGFRFPPSPAFLRSVLAMPASLTRSLVAIGAGSAAKALEAAKAILRRDHSKRTHLLAGTLARIKQEGHSGTPLDLVATTLHGGSLTAPNGGKPAASAITRRLVSFSAFADGTVLTSQTASVGASFGSAPALGFTVTPPAFLCGTGPTIAGGAAVAPSCPAASAGEANDGTLIKLTYPARSVTVMAGATHAFPGGFAAEVDAFDAHGNQLTQDATLVGSSTNGQGTGATQTLSVTDPNGRPPIAYVAIYDNSHPTNSTPVLEFANLVLTG